MQAYKVVITHTDGSTETMYVVITHTDGSTETMYHAADTADKAEAFVRQHIIDRTGAPPAHINVLERTTFSGTGSA
jgi:hypothetical protein